MLEKILPKVAATVAQPTDSANGAQPTANGAAGAQ